MDNLRLLIEQHMDVVFFTYGLAFFALGLVVLVQPKEESRYEISQLSGWLASFGLVHGTLEWLSLWKIAHGDSAVLSLLKIVFLLVSYVFLFEFGRRLTRSILDKIPSIPNLVRRMLGAPIYGVVALGFLFELLTVPDRMLAMTIAARYFLGGVGSFLTGIGFLLSVNKKSPQQVENSAFSWSMKYFVLAAAAFFFYGVLSCFVEYPANIVSASVFNDQWFLDKFHFPVQMFRASSAVLAAIAIGNILRVFHLEVREKLLYSLKLAKETEAELRIAAIAFETQEGIMVTNAKSVILRVNNAFTGIAGYPAEEAVGLTPRLLRSGRHDEAFYAVMWKNLRQNGAWRGEIWNRRKNGEIYPEFLTITAVKNDDGEVTHYVGTMDDITQRKQTEQQIYDLAFYDPLTRLPNRRLLSNHLEQALAASRRSGRHGALLFIDMDRFKTLNDTHGHPVGDLLLVEVARRIRSCVREVDTVSRFGGDEFLVMIVELKADRTESIMEAGIVAEKIRAILSKTYVLELEHESKAKTSIEHNCSSSIGVALFIAHDSSRAEDIIKWADMAMYQAKETGGNLIRFYDN